MRVPRMSAPISLKGRRGRGVPLMRLASRRGTVFSCFVPIGNVRSRLYGTLAITSSRLGGGRATSEKGLMVGNKRKDKGAALTADVVGILRRRAKILSKGVKGVRTRTLGRGGINKLLSGITKKYLVVRRTKSVRGGAISRLSKLLSTSRDNLFIVLRSASGNVGELFTRGRAFTGGFDRRVSIPVFAGSRLIAFTHSCSERLKCGVSSVTILTLCGQVDGVRELSRTAALARIGSVISRTVRQRTRKKLGGTVDVLATDHCASSSEVMLARGSFRWSEWRGAKEMFVDGFARVSYCLFKRTARCSVCHGVNTRGVAVRKRRNMYFSI